MFDHLHRDNVDSVQRTGSSPGGKTDTGPTLTSRPSVSRFYFVGQSDVDLISKRWVSALDIWPRLRAIAKTFEDEQVLVILKSVPFRPVFDARADRYLPGAQPIADQAKLDLERGPLCQTLITTYQDAFTIDVTIAEGLLAPSEMASLALWLATGVVPSPKEPPASDVEIDVWGSLPRSEIEATQFSWREVLDESTASAMLRYARGAQCSTGDVIALAWGMLLSVYTDSDRVSFHIVDWAEPRSQLQSVQVTAGATLAELVRQPVSRTYGGSPSDQSPPICRLFIHDGPSSPRCVDHVPAGAGSSLDLHFFDTCCRPTLAIWGSGDPRVARRVLENFKNLLGHALSAPSDPHWRTRILGAAELASLQDNSRPPRTRDCWFLAEVESAIARFPDRICVRDGETSLTYAALAELVDSQVAQLQRHRIGRGDIVVVVSERGALLIAVVLALSRLGAIYLPISPDGPPDRNRRIIAAARPAAVATTAPWRAAIDEIISNLRDAPICIDISATPQSVLEPLSSGDSLEGPQASDIANIFFTSGTTGQPKGAMIEHVGLYHHLAAKIEVCGLTEHSIVAQNAPQTFDISVWQMLAPLMVGGTVVVYQAETANDPQSLVDALVRDRVTVLESVPTYIKELNRLARKAHTALPDLRVLVSNAEALSAADCADWLEHHNNTVLINTYGATECSDDVTHKSYTAPPRRDLAHLSVGRPISGGGIFVLGRYGTMQPPGCEGAVFITGVCVGRGYVNDAQLTSDAFLPNTIDERAEYGRMYRTGDRGYLQTDGDLVILGRDDDQVKISGYRVELGEIQAAVRATGAFREFHILASAAADDGGAIECYFVDAARPLDSVISDMRQRLPAYMVPSVFFEVDRIPVTSHGKVDSRQLRQLAREASRVAPLPPETAGERHLHAIWSDILQRSDFGIDDDFFRLGGNSIRTIQVRYRLRRDLGLDLPIATLFAKRTIRALASLLPEAEQAKQPAPEIGHADLERPVRASPLQRGLWFLQLIEPDSSAYNMLEAIDLSRGVDVPSLSAAVQQLILWHPILACSVIQPPSGPPVLVSRSHSSTLAVSEAKTSEALEAIIEREKNRVYDLATDPLFRVHCVQRWDNSTTLIVAMHHIISDERSWQLIKRDLADLYGGQLAGRASARSPKRSYLDFAEWHSGWSESSQARDQLEAWQHRLEGTDLWLELPHGSSQASNLGKPGRVEVEIPASSISRLDAVCLSQQTTSFVGALSIYAAFLSLLTGRNRYCVATALSCRPLVDMDDVAGLFVNLLPLRVQPDSQADFAALVGSVRNELHWATERALVPLHAIVESVQPIREERRKNAFSTAYFEISGQAEEVGIFAGGRLRHDQVGTNRFDLVVTLVRAPDKTWLRLEYDGRVLDCDTVERWARNYRLLFANLVASPELPIGDAIERLLRDDAKPIVGDLVTKSSRTVVELIAERAIVVPDDIAVQGKDSALSYATLMAEARAIAAEIEQRHSSLAGGASAPLPIAVAVSPGPRLAVALLGVLLSGHPYLPIDVTMPRDRIAYVRENSGARLALIDDATAQVLADFDAFINLDQTRAGQNPTITRLPAPSDLAYVIYTSGSTGRPKGVRIGHQALSNALQGFALRLGAEPLRRVLGLTSVSFDIFALELWLPLITGGCSILSPRDRIFDPEALADLVDKFQPTLIQATPSAWSMMLPLLASRLGATTVLVGGEALPDPLARALATSSMRLLNCYGPTEATIWASITDVDTSHPASIGGVLPNVSFYILDERGRLVSRGAVGELHIASDSLAEGYVNLDEETAARFASNPHRNTDTPQHWDNRIYRTGDFVRHEQTGHLTFLGRRDGQIKLRGHRIELGEIERVLEESPAIRQAAVHLEGENPSDAQLVASVSPMLSHHEREELTSFLASKLPEYMVPRRWLFLPTLPLSTSGKIDRIALRMKAAESRGVKETGGEARTPVENAILGCWIAVLGGETFGVDEDFFASGGNSISAVALASRVSATVKRRFTVADVFRSPTIAAMAKALESKGEYSPSTIVPLGPGKSSEPLLFMVHPQGGGVACYQRLAQALNNSLSCFGIQAPGYGEPDVTPLNTVAQLVARYADDIDKQCGPEQEINLVGWSFGGALAVELCREFEARGRRVGFLGLLDAAPFKIEPAKSDEVSELALKRWFVSVYLEDSPIDEASLSLDQVNEILLAGLCAKGLLPEVGAQAELDHQIAFMRHNIDVATTFRFVRPIQADIWLFAASERPRRERRALVTSDVWTGYTRGRVHLVPIAGHHHTILDAEHVGQLARMLRDAITPSNNQSPVEMLGEA